MSKETPLDDPSQQADWGSHKQNRQTVERLSWKGTTARRHEAGPGKTAREQHSLTAGPGSEEMSLQPCHRQQAISTIGLSRREWWQGYCWRRLASVSGSWSRPLYTRPLHF